MTALVSIIIPCYNAEPYIGETLESVFQQSWPNIEVIVVDDGSTDRSGDVIRRFQRQGLRHIRQENAGAGTARNRGYANATGDFIQFLDADDLVSPDKIQSQMRRLLDRSDCVASAMWARFQTSIDEARFLPEAVWRDLDPLNWLILSRLDGEGMLFPALWLMPRAIVDAAGPWDESLSLGDDGEYFSRVLLAAREVLFCSDAKCYYRSGVQGSLSSQRSLSAYVSAYRVLEKCEARIRSREDSQRVRRGFALSWQYLAVASYPYDRQLAERGLERAQSLYPVVVRPQGGIAFKALSRLVGWRTARKIQVLSGRF